MSRPPSGDNIAAGADGGIHPRMILSVNTGGGLMNFVQPSKPSYPEWHIAEAPQPPSPLQDEEEEEVEYYEEEVEEDEEQPEREVGKEGEEGSAAAAAAAEDAPSTDASSFSSPASSVGSKKVKRTIVRSRSNLSAASPTSPHDSASSPASLEDESAVTYSYHCADRARQCALSLQRGLGFAVQDNKEAAGLSLASLKSGSGEGSLPMMMSPARVNSTRSLLSTVAVQRASPARAAAAKAAREARSPQRLEEEILEGIETTPPPPPQENHKMVEEDIVNAEHRTMLWSEHLLAVLSGFTFADAFLRVDAARSIASTFSPPIKRRIALWEKKAHRAALTQKQFENARRPSVAVLRAISNFFIDWNEQSLAELLTDMDCVSYKAGEPVFHQGDWSSDLYLVKQGSVELTVRTGCDPAHPKSRRKTNGVVVNICNHGDMFGDKALLFREARCASAYCATDTDLWRVSRELFVHCSSSIPPITHERFRRLADESRLGYLALAFPLEGPQLKQHYAFSSWNVAALKCISQMFTPRVFRGNDVICCPKDSEAKMFFIASGKLKLTPEVGGSASARYFGPGDVIGVKEVVFCEHWSAVGTVAEGPIEAWVLTRSSWLDAAREFPRCAVDSKEAIHRELESTANRPDLYHPAIPAILSDPYMEFCVPPEILQDVFLATAKPLFLSQDTPLVRGGASAVDSIVVLIEGTVYDEGLRRYHANRRLKAEHSDSTRATDMLALEGFRIVDPAGTSGPDEASPIVFGSVEFATSETTFRHNVRCASNCVAWSFSRQKLEELLQIDYPAIWFAMQQQRESVAKIADEGDSSQLLELFNAPKNAIRLLPQGSPTSAVSQYDWDAEAQSPC